MESLGVGDVDIQKRHGVTLAGVVDEHVQAGAIVSHGLGSGPHRLVRTDVELEDCDVWQLREFGRDLGCGARGCVEVVTVICELPGDGGADAAR